MSLASSTGHVVASLRLLDRCLAFGTILDSQLPLGLAKLLLLLGVEVLGLVTAESTMTLVALLARSRKTLGAIVDARRRVTVDLGTIWRRAVVVVERVGADVGSERVLQHLLESEGGQELLQVLQRDQLLAGVPLTLALDFTEGSRLMMGQTVETVGAVMVVAGIGWDHRILRIAEANCADMFAIRAGGT
jgi:hypothetical protein